jgi:pre-rRNA-processing protein IPI1
MPAKRKRNAPSDKSSGKDFKKLKAKVGKKIPNAASHTKTDFKSARIVLPDQSINEEKGGAVTRRNLNLSDLLSQIQHYNVAIRKQAYVGFRELFISSPEVLKTELGSVISKFPKGFIDEDRSVRDVTLLLLRHVLDKTTKAQLAPFLKLLLSWLKIGLTHMNERVRLDSIRATEAVVAAGVCEWGDAELMAPAVLAVLSEGAKSTTRSQNVGIKLKPAKSKRSPSDRHGIIITM